eukprot:Hpha_TRINITY_DN16462_c3_g2::TRINITY_DN16462_c3_g2_i1::g.161911::m.161911/K13811/PAPSS; 3'-phosphoadenosine 5'-phosphosulfate synthase
MRGLGMSQWRTASPVVAAMGERPGSNSKIVLGVAVMLIGGFLVLRPAQDGAPTGGGAKVCPTSGQLRNRVLAGQKQASKNIYLDTFDSIKHSDRASALGHKGATVWLTGLSGSGKSTIGKALEKKLVLEHGVHLYRLDGDNLRFGLSRDLGLASEDRQEAVRRAYEVASLFADSGSITLVSLISPFRADRDEARELHDRMGLPFIEVFVDVPVSVAEARDPKGLYKKVRKGEIKGFTGIDAPYEAPLRPEVTLKSGTCCGSPAAEAAVKQCKAAGGSKCKAETDRCIDACVDVLKAAFVERGLITPSTQATSGVSKPPPRIGGVMPHAVTAHADGYPYGTTPPSLVYDNEEFWYSDEVTELLPVQVRDVEVQWIQVIAEGWAAPFKGPMRESALVQTLHFNSVLFDATDKTGVAGASGYGGPTNFGDTESAAKLAASGDRVSSPVPLIVPVSKQVKNLIKWKKAKRVLLVSPAGEPLAILKDPEVYDFRKEELVTRHWGSWDPDHPYVKEVINSAEDYLIGGEIEKARRIKFRDGLDQWRLTPQELVQEFKSRGADGVFAFQTRNPTHAGHAHLMKDGRRQLIQKGFKNPVLWLSPLGGWTKSDDAPLDVRVKQHQAVLD